MRPDLDAIRRQCQSPYGVERAKSVADVPVLLDYIQRLETELLAADATLLLIKTDRPSAHTDTVWQAVLTRREAISELLEARGGC